MAGVDQDDELFASSLLVLDSVEHCFDSDSVLSESDDSVSASIKNSRVTAAGGGEVIGQAPICCVCACRCMHTTLQIAFTSANTAYIAYHKIYWI